MTFELYTNNDITFVVVVVCDLLLVPFPLLGSVSPLRSKLLEEFASIVLAPALTLSKEPELAPRPLVGATMLVSAGGERGGSCGTKPVALEGGLGVGGDFERRLLEHKHFKSLQKLL